MTHHNVYVVTCATQRRWQGGLLRRHDRLTPEQRFANHKAGIKSASVVRRYGERLVPVLYEHLNPMPYDDALRMEGELAESLRKRGFVVLGGIDGCQTRVIRSGCDAAEAALRGAGAIATLTSQRGSLVRATAAAAMPPNR